MHVKHVQNNIPHISLDSNGTIINLITESLREGEPCMQEHLLEHFHSDGHNCFLENVEITLIDKTDGRDPKSRENYWMRMLKVLAPHGLNIEDCV